MRAAIHSEFRKFFSTRMWWVLSLCMVVFFFGSAFVMGWMMGFQSGHNGFSPDLANIVRPAIYGLAPSMGYIFPVIIGALAVTAEYRFKTAIPTFLAAPRRGMVMAAKVIAALPMGLVLGVIATLACLAGGALGFSSMGMDPHLFSLTTLQGAGLSVLAFTVWALVGVGLGMLVISQVGVIIATLAFTQLLEPILRLGLGAFDATANLAMYLPGAASSALAGGSNIYTLVVGSGSNQVLPIWQGGLVLAAYGLVFALLGYVLRIRRDVA